MFVASLYQMKLFTTSNLIDMKNSTTPMYNASKLIPGQTYKFEILLMNVAGAFGLTPKSACRFTTGRANMLHLNFTQQLAIFLRNL